MNQYLKTIQDLLQQKKELSEADKEALIKAITDADKQWSITDFKLDRTEKVKKTTAILLEETIEELEQKRKAVEAQNRELEIESSLERVRTVAMGMKKPDDLLSICEVLFKELQILGFGELRNALIHTFVDEQNYFNDYDYSDFAGGAITRTPYTGHPVVEKFIKEIRKAKDAFSENIVAGKELEDWKGFRTANGQAHDPRLDGISTLYYYIYSIGPADIGISTFSAISNEKRELLKRFRNVFDLAYRRYTDIQQAEEQARESQIQLSLERVRARAMAMQTSDELKELISTVFIELTKLDLALTRCVIMIYDAQSNASTWWMANSEAPADPIGLYVKNHQHPPYLAFIRGWKDRKNKLQYTLEGEDKSNWDDFLFSETELSHLPDFVIAGMKAPDRVYLSISFNNFGCLNLASLEPLSDEHFDILLRFAKVFDLTYTRFNDLQKAEAQARESQIQLALERVRARTMAMQKSEELGEVSALLFQQVHTLGIDSYSSGFTIWDHEKKELISWMCNADGSMNPPFYMPIEGHDLHIRQYASWQQGEACMTVDMDGEIMQSYFRYLRSFPLLDEAFKISVAAGHPMPGRQVHNIANFVQGNLLFITLVPVPETQELFTRFAKVFEQAYTRFLDLQKAEAQAREARIEAALEKVRSRSLAVHQSEEFKDVISVVFEKLQELDIPVESASINIFIEGSKDTDVYACGHSENGLDIRKVRLRYFDHPIANDLYNAHKNGLDFFVGSYGIKEKNSYYQYQFEHADLKELPSEIKERILKTEHYSLSMAPAKHSIIIINNFDGKLLSDTEIDILKRFSRVFEQAYTRFLDLQKAEAQARESQIQLALERVRARTMAMQKSDELREAVLVIYEQLKLLNFESNACNIIIIDKESGSAQYWVSGFSQEIFPVSYNVPYLNHPYSEALLKPWKRGDKYLVYEYSGKMKQGFDQIFFTQTDFRNVPEEAKKMMIGLKSVMLSTAFISYGALQVIGAEPLSVENAEILQRFGKVFEQTYTRFLDLQKAEAQAREATIEAALERVRSRSMAMHKSEELKEVIRIVYEQFVHLNILVEHAGFIVDYKTSDDMHIWLADRHEVPSEITIPYFDSPHWNSFIEAKEKEKDFFANQLNFEEKNKFYQKLFKLFPVPGEATEYYLNCPGLAISTVLLENVGLYIENFSGIPYTDEENTTLMRFGKVFQQTYTRFLDLQKAEAQAREAQIEAALEKVRSRSLAMHQSDELEEVIMVVSEQLQQLQFRFHNASFVRYNEQKGMNFWLASPGQPQPYLIEVPFLDNPLYTRPLEAVKNGVDFIADVLTPEENHEWLDHLFKYSVLKNVSEDDKKFLRSTTGFSRSLMITKNIILVIGNYAAVPYTDEQNHILRRFGYVFEQAYTRFLDLQKAEAQARESQIQLALERVRARTMAMQKSEELNDVAGLLFQQISELGIKAWTTGFNVWADDNNSYTDYITSPQGNLIKAYTIDVTKLSAFTEISDAKKSGKEFWVQYLQGDRLKEVYKQLSDFGEEKQYEKMLEDGFQFPSHQYDHFVFGSKVSLMFITYDPVPEAHDIFKRFGRVFEQTYTRFNDLKQAEAQALEAIKRTSVDRVRAEIASMRTTADLERITPLIWNELNTLGVPFIRCGVFIMDDDQQEVQTLLSTPDGKAIAAFRQPYDAPGEISAIVHSWHKKEIYKQHWNEAQFLEFAKNLVQQGAVTSGEKYLTENRPADLYLHFLPFLQGMLYVGNTASFSESELQLVQNLADAFSTAYARYEDFNKLEAAKKQVDNTLNELQVTQKQLIQSEKMASLGELTAGIAHEIQNPLNFVNNFSDVSHELLEEMKTELEKGNKEDAMAIAEDVKHNLEKILHHGKRADAIVKGMLQHSRTGSGQKELTDINALADEYLRLAYHGLRAKDKSFNAALHHDFDKSIDKVNIIPQDIGRVLVNLINNAFYAVNVKARKNIPGYEPALTITTKKMGDKVELRVADNGVGIPPKVLDKIFHPFFTTKPTGQGTGLGLSMAYDIITKGHGGELKVKTKEGEGSEFCIKIPVSKTPA